MVKNVISINNNTNKNNEINGVDYKEWEDEEKKSNRQKISKRK